VDNLGVCGNPSEAEVLQATSVWRVTEGRINDLSTGTDRRMVVWNAEAFEAEWFGNGDLCAAMHLTPLAVGTASHEVLNDNDLFGQTGHNSWGYRVHGQLGEYRTTYQVRMQFNVKHDPPFRVISEHGSIR